MSEKKIRLQISTPNSEFFNNDVDMVIAKTITGDIGILPKHVPLVTILDIGALRIKMGDKERKAEINGGFLEIEDNKIIILADSAEWPEDIDLARAEKAKIRAEERLKNRKDIKIDYARAELSLKRAINRIKTTKGWAFAYSFFIDDKYIEKRFKKC